jgi:hypothetical protein
MVKTKWLRLTRSVFLDGRHAEEGSIQDVAQPLADDLIGQGSAVQMNFVFRFFARIWFFAGSRTKREEVGTAQVFSQGETAMDRTEKAVELIERAAKLGLRVEFRSGTNILTRTVPVNPEVITLMARQLTDYLPEVRALAQRRAVAALGKNLVGRRIWSKEHGEGTLVDGVDDGTFTISIGAEVRRSDEEETVRRSHSITANAEDLLILVETSPNGCAAHGED